MQEGIGLDAINDAFLLESSVYRVLKKYCGQQPYYLHLLELFLQVSPAPQPLPDFLGSGPFLMFDSMCISECSLNPWASCWTQPAFGLTGAETGLGVCTVLLAFSWRTV